MLMVSDVLSPAAHQEGRIEQRASTSLWEYLINYVTGAAQPPRLQLSHSYRRGA